MRAVLTADLPLARVAIFAELAWLERRPELGLLCRLAGDQGRRLTRGTVRAALPGLQDAGADNVVAWCRTLGLCDERGALTTLGQEVGERDEAPVPEQGVVGLSLTSHPVLGRRILAVERLAATPDQRFEAIEPLAVEPERGRPFTSVLDPRERFLLRDLPLNHDRPGGVPGTTRGSCRLRWTLDFTGQRDQWQLEGLLEAPVGKGRHELRPIQHQPETDGLDLWRLVEHWASGPLAPHGQWRGKARRLAVPFDGLSAEEQEGFRKTLPLGRVEVPGKGSYEDVTLEDVPIGPATAQDARRWALARLDRYLVAEPRYRSRTTLAEAFAALVEDTPLAPFGPALPDHDSLLDRYAEDPEQYWGLAAPMDLSPERRAAPGGAR